ncbi:hypothetical protein [Rhizobium sp. CSW-27]|uniref:hypothetical protein n=1 Tax=Rhizobium sp. CSW-27 TaxID=2839985 RepID=UPI001C018C29|nr:hypothetical protein [Rhizobium sp. CSW-27]MBT9372528.1 hypothetical protein [Rhizobium sp. CSW-27]
MAKILGSYEREIFEAIESEIARRPDVIVNIGASEGYYAIGLKRRLPDAEVYTYDIDERSFPVLDRCMSQNGVKVVRLDKFDYGHPLDGVISLSGKTALFVLDCEGYENHVVDMPRSVVANSSFIIELHDLFMPGTRERLLEFLSPSHSITIINQQIRQPSDFPELAELRRPVAQLLLDEFRHDAMQWLYAVPK